MFKRILVLSMWFVLLVTYAEADQKKRVVQPPNTLLYSISLKDKLLQVKIDCPATATESAIFSISDWAGVKNYGENIFHAEAISDNGEALKVERPFVNRWVVFHKGKPFSLKYVVISSKTSFMGSKDDEYFHPTLLKDLIFLWGYSYMLKPHDELLSSLPIRLHLDEQSLISPHSSFPNDTVFASANEMTDSLVIAGDFRHITFPIMGIPIDFYLYGKKWAFTDQEFVTLFGKIMNRQAQAMGMYPTQRMMVVLTEGKASSSGGTVVKDAIALYPSPDNGPIEEDVKLLELVAHEHFHLWNGGDCLFPATGHEEGYYKWFQEGFTDYFAQLSLAQEGLISDEEFRLWMNRTIRKYYMNPYSMTASNDDIEQSYWVNANFTKLPYEKGAVIAFIFDHAIRKFSGNHKTLADYFQALLNNKRAMAEGYDVKILNKTLVELTDASFQNFFDECVMGAKEIPFNELTVKLSLPMKTVPTKMFELGFEVDKSSITKGAQVTKVVHGSAAEKAGICQGDILGGIRIYNGDPTKEVKLDVIREGRKQTISFFPAKEGFIFQLVTR